jgi:phosphohistidine phosphatase
MKILSIYFVQHGVALAKNLDEQRPLSTVGIDETRGVAIKLKSQNIAISKIFHSGKLRAAQTATLFAEILNIESIAELSGMNPNDDPCRLIEQLSEDGTMYIGHLPHMKKVVSTLVTNNTNSNIVEFQNSAVVCLEISEDRANFKWIITPNVK